MTRIVHSIAYNCYEQIMRRLNNTCTTAYEDRNDSNCLTIITIRPLGTSSQYRLLFYDGLVLASTGLTPVVTHYFEDQNFPLTMLDEIESWVHQELTPTWMTGSQNASDYDYNRPIHTIYSQREALSVDAP